MRRKAIQAILSLLVLAVGLFFMACGGSDGWQSGETTLITSMEGMSVGPLEWREMKVAGGEDDVRRWGWQVKLHNSSERAWSGKLYSLVVLQDPGGFEVDRSTHEQEICVPAGSTYRVQSGGEYDTYPEGKLEADGTFGFARLPRTGLPPGSTAEKLREERLLEGRC